MGRAEQRARKRLRRKHSGETRKLDTETQTAKQTAIETLNAEIAKQAGLTGKESTLERIGKINDLSLYENAVPVQSKRAVKSKAKTANIFYRPNHDGSELLGFAFGAKKIKPKQNSRVCKHYILQPIPNSIGFINRPVPYVRLNISFAEGFREMRLFDHNFKYFKNFEIVKTNIENHKMVDGKTIRVCGWFCRLDKIPHSFKIKFPTLFSFV